MFEVLVLVLVFFFLCGEGSGARREAGGRSGWNGGWLVLFVSTE
jgi:hypothetical protein